MDALIYDYSFTENSKKSCSDRENLSPFYNVVGIKWESDKLKERLAKRLDKMFIQKLYDETEVLVEKYGWGSQAMKSDIYEFAWKYMQGELTLDEAKKLCLYKDYHLAKRQMTWFKRNKDIKWLPLEKVKPYVLKCIQDE